MLWEKNDKQNNTEGVRSTVKASKKNSTWLWLIKVFYT